MIKFLVTCSSVVAIPFSAFYFSNNNVSNAKLFDFEGSSSMKVIIESLLKKYKEKNPTENFSVSISTIGSGAGLRNVLNGSSSFALVSHDVSEYKKTHENTWKTRKLKTITLATEAMLVVYKPSKNCQEDLVIDANNVEDFYSMFFGIKDSFNLGSSNCKFTPWVKNTGPSKSGTAKAFIDNPLLKDKTILVNQLNSGYGSNSLLNYTPESTTLHWEIFKSNLEDGSITYLPSHFVFANWELIQSLGLKIASIKISDKTVKLDKSDFSSKLDEYCWKRTFNLIYSTSDLSDRSDFLQKFLENLCDLTSLYLKPGDTNQKDTISNPDISD